MAGDDKIVQLQPPQDGKTCHKWTTVIVGPGTIAGNIEAKIIQVPCVQKSCTYWDEEFQACGALVKAKSLNMIAQNLCNLDYLSNLEKPNGARPPHARPLPKYRYCCGKSGCGAFESPTPPEGNSGSPNVIKCPKCGKSENVSFVCQC
ncbi:MAG: hypothetical protein ACYTBJ_06730 [Planctomycetota bacterium]|jgi:hypothetical protein